MKKLTNKKAKTSMLQTLAFSDVVRPGLPASFYPYSAAASLHVGLIEMAGLQRAAYNRDFGYCLPTDEVLTLLARMLKAKKTLDAGSGSGWLADALAERGVDVVACDRVDYRKESNSGYPLRVVHRLDVLGDVLDFLPGSFDAVLLVWPNYKVEFAENVAKAMRSGQMLVFEGEESGGYTGSDEFFSYRDRMFDASPALTRMLNNYHVSFPMLHDRWWVGIKRDGPK